MRPNFTKRYIHIAWYTSTAGLVENIHVHCIYTYMYISAVCVMNNVFNVQLSTFRAKVETLEEKLEVYTCL